MKIILITQYFAPAWSYGGPPRIFYNLAKRLSHLGHNVIVLTSDSQGDVRSMVSNEKIDGINIYRLKTLSNYLSFKYKLFIIPEILHILKKEIDGTDYVLFSDLRTFIAWQTYNFLFSKKIPYGIFAFGQIPYDNSWKGFVKKVFDHIWVNDFVKNAKYRFCQTEHERKMYSEYFQIKKKDTQLLLLPIDTKAYIYKKETLDFYRKKFKIKKNDVVFLFVGRLDYLKGVDILIKALIKVMTQDTNIKLLIVGRDDGDLKRLRRLVPNEFFNRILFISPLYHKDLIPIYKLSKCFIMTPRYYEETSTAALEALSYGLPVITTKEANLPYLELYKAGYVIENNHEVIRRCIEKISEELDRRKKVLEFSAKKLIRENYHVNIVTDKMLQILRSK